MAIKTTVNGVCLFNAVCTATWGKDPDSPDETDPIALALRVALLVDGVKQLEKHICGSERSFLRSRHAYDGDMIDGGSSNNGG